MGWQKAWVAGVVTTLGLYVLLGVLAWLGALETVDLTQVLLALIGAPAVGATAAAAVYRTRNSPPLDASEVSERVARPDEFERHRRGHMHGGERGHIGDSVVWTVVGVLVAIALLIYIVNALTG